MVHIRKAMFTWLRACRPYCVATLLVGVAFGVRFTTDPLLKSHGPFLVFVLAVAGAAILGGLASGLLATALSALIAVWFFIAPRYTFEIAGTEEWTYLILFLSESVLFCALAESLRRAQDQCQGLLENERVARDRADVAAATSAEEICLRQAVEQDLRRSNADLERFAMVVSHDMKEPLRTIRQHALELLATPPVAAEAAEKIEAAIDSVEALISDLLAYARLDHLQLDSSMPVRLDDVIEWTKANLAALIDETSAELTYDSLPAVLADFGALAQLFQDLITNAIKYRGQAAPRIHVNVEQDDASCTISVRDNGMGIDAAYAERIFDPFIRLASRNVPGTGIGLAICRRIVERLRGRIWMQQCPEGGSIFLFTLPASRIVENVTGNTGHSFSIPNDCASA